jgi:hypothetical protein
VQDNRHGDREPGQESVHQSGPQRSPGRAMVAAGAGAVLLVLWTLRGAGAIALIVLPVLVLYVANVYLGGGLNQSPLAGIDRIRQWRSQR